jgi:hypothetical protein
VSAASTGAYSTSWPLGAAVGWESLIASIGAPRSSASDSSGPFVVNPGAVSKLQVLVPGETPAPGTASGKTGTPVGQVAGVPFQVTLNAVDANWNLVASADVVHLVSSDGAAVLPADGPLVAGTRAASVTLNTVGSQTVTVSDVTNAARTANVSAAIPVVAGGSVFTVSGTVSPAVDGVGSSLALSGAASASTLANIAGAYQFASLTPGAYVLTPSKPGFTFVPPSLPVTITTANVSAVDFTIVAVDAGPADAGTADAGTTDAGTTDAGPMDAGASDGGPPDGGPGDAGPADAGPADAGSSTDGGVGSSTLEVRCGCASVEAPTALLWLLLVAWSTRARRTRPVALAPAPQLGAQLVACSSDERAAERAGAGADRRL